MKYEKWGDGFIPLKTIWRKNNMAYQIGKMETVDGKSIITFQIPFSSKTSVQLIPNAKKSDKTPDYRLTCGGLNCGELWVQTSKQGNKYLSGNINSLEKPIKIVLFSSDNFTTGIVTRSEQNTSSDGSTKSDDSIGIGDDEPIF